jgi:hypothetical protein
MTLILSGTDGLSDVDGSAATPALRGTDANTGIFFPAADTIAFAEGGAEVMRIDSDGDVGIGTTSPASRLHVSDAVAGGQVLVTTNETNSTSKIGSLATMHYTNAEEPVLAISVEGGASENTVQIGGGPGEFNASTSIRFFTAANSTTTGGTERARITSDGYFKISNDGTYNSSTSTAHEIRQSVSNNVGLLVSCSNASFSSNAFDVYVNRNTTNASYYLITAGVLGVGTRFQVADSGNVQNTNNSYGAISDIKLKENIVDASPKLDKLNQVRIVNFNMIGAEQKQIGVVAQELEQVFPGMVEEMPDKDEEGNDLGTTTKAVKYSVFVPMLIKAMQEQQALITALTTRITALEAA